MRASTAPAATAAQGQTRSWGPGPPPRGGPASAKIDTSHATVDTVPTPAYSIVTLPRTLLSQPHRGWVVHDGRPGGGTVRDVGQPISTSTRESSRRVSLAA